MSTLSLWTQRNPWTERNPFAEFDALVRTSLAPLERPRAFVPASELTRDGDDAVVKLELPGLDVTNDVSVELDRGRLVVHGERRQEKTETQSGTTLRELRYGSFRRSFALPAHVTADAISASYDAGVLSVRIRGAYSGATAERIQIANGGATEPELAESAE
ncbi:Hsp20/alpha crystallin family protein [Jatrophihabitans cynanchi]|jgi:HSP20 family molecular chaperone IbpA|uniref:Hsp20/alpha crystallin family protein n=1 Tax=Jatrophihabitans cynanchi TaxID=2944128 RepID=UPI0022B22A6A|nr:Hsp20/alpha crystallin family protein [Jatrophihabitans sp. SB3-54]